MCVITAAVIVEVLLVLISLPTGQLVRFSYCCFKDVFEKFPKLRHMFKIGFCFCAIIIFSSLNIAPMVMVFCDWINPQVTVFKVSFLFNVEKMNKTKIPTIVLRDVTDGQQFDPHNLNDSQTVDNLLEFEVFTKLEILFYALSSCVSFCLFMLAIMCTYMYRLKICNTKPPNDVENGQDNNRDLNPLNPFCADDGDTSTRLQWPESAYFIIIWIVNVAFWVTCTVLFVEWHYYRPAYYNSTLPITTEAAGFGIYMYSLLCTIASCFIFSKLAHTVTYKCLKLVNKLNDGKCTDDNAGLDFLMEEDNKFTKQAQATLNLFEWWFTFHWILYTVTTFLSIAIFVDMFIKYIQAGLPEPPKSAIGFSNEQLWVVGLFTLSHCFLFLYPCFKAAAVTVSREKLIKKVNASTKCKLSHERKLIFIQYLKNKKYGFRISFFCARLRFSFNIAYISIFIGLLGVLLKVTSVF